MTQKSLLLVAHGSRRAESNEEIGRLTEALRAAAGERFHSVSHAFLEIAEPSIAEGIEALVQAGVGTIHLVPYFLAAGRHVEKDIPAVVEAQRREHPHVRIEIAPHLGSSSHLSTLLLQLVPLD